MSSLKKISIGAASYDIIPDAITDSNANYKASCPTISSNTTIEVASNKTTVINSSSSDNQYPSAKAVFTAIQNASREGSFAPNIHTSTDPSFAPLVSSGGMLNTTYLQNFWIPKNKVMGFIDVDGGSTVYSMAISGTVSELFLENSTAIGKITKFGTGKDTTIGDSTIPTTSDTTIGQNGLYGKGNIYIATTGSSTPSTSDYAFTGSIINKAGVSDSVHGGYIETINNNDYATISKLTNALNGHISTIENSGSIEQMRNTGTIDCLYVDSGRITTVVGQESTANINFTTSTAAPMWGVVTNGKVNPWLEVPNVATLVSLLNEQTGILYKYTGSTTTYNGIEYTNNNFYRYEA